MREISKEYTLLFNAITDAVQALEQLQTALQLAQRCAEELYVSDTEEEAIPLKPAS